MVKKLPNLILLILLWFYTDTYGAGRNNFWITGYQNVNPRPFGNSIITFNNSTPDTAYLQGPLNFRRSCATICDTNGSLLCYTNGISIANANHEIMQNGGGLNPSSYTTSMEPYGQFLLQSVLFIPRPAHEDTIYLIHQTADIYNGTDVVPQYLYYSTIDMNQNGGLGAVVLKNAILLEDTLSGGELIAVRHGNGRDWWLLAHRHMSNTFIKYLITSQGIMLDHYQSIGTASPTASVSQSSFNPEGNLLARSTVVSGVDLFDFDRCTGLLSNCRSDTFGGNLNRVRCSFFSPNSKLLYVSAVDTLYQYNLDSVDLIAGRQIVGVYDGYLYDGFFPSTFYTGMLAPNNKIYLSTTNGAYGFHVINDPDSAGVACNFEQHSFVLPTWNASTHINQANFDLGAMQGSSCDTLPTALPHAREDQKLSVYYDPALQQLQLKTGWSNDERCALSLIDLNGKEVYTQTVISQGKELKEVVDCRRLNSGLYLLLLKGEQQVMSKKVLIR
jgi:hypothetical protein